MRHELHRSGFQVLCVSVNLSRASSSHRRTQSYAQFDVFKFNHDEVTFEGKWKIIPVFLQLKKIGARSHGGENHDIEYHVY